MNKRIQTQENGAGMFSAPKRDFLASIVVFLVALPLCMGIAIASGVPVAAGLITGIVGGLVVGWIAGSPLQVSGPAAGLTVIVYDLVQHHGLEVLGMAVLIGGLLQLAAGLLCYGRWFRAVSPAVVHGMLAGIGVLILTSQFHVMVDDAPKGSGIKNIVSIPEAIQKGMPIPELGTVQERTLRRDLLQQFGTLHEKQVQLREFAAEKIPAREQDEEDSESHDSIADDRPSQSELKQLALKQKELSSQLIVLVEKLNVNHVAETVRDPSGLTEATRLAVEQSEVAYNDLDQGHVAQVRESQASMQHSLEEILSNLKNHDWAAKIGLLTIFVLILWSTGIPASWKLIPAPLVAVVVATGATIFLKLPVLYVEIPDNLLSDIHIPSLTIFESVSFGVILQAGIVLAVVASAETLLCATAVDQMQTISRTNYDKELAAQGVGNIICGFMGALPMTGVIVRSSANVGAGGRTRLSTILHGLWLLIFVALLGFILRMIPTAALAAILVYTGYKLVNFKVIRELKKYGWGEVFIYFSTLGMIVFTDLLTGVIVGILLSAAKLLYKFTNLKVRLEKHSETEAWVLVLIGSATFVRLPRLADALERVEVGSEVHIDCDRLAYIDHACLDLIANWAKQHEAQGGSIIVDWEALHAHFHRNTEENLQRSV